MFLYLIKHIKLKIIDILTGVFFKHCVMIDEHTDLSNIKKWCIQNNKSWWRIIYVNTNTQIWTATLIGNHEYIGITQQKAPEVRFFNKEDAMKFKLTWS